MDINTLSRLFGYFAGYIYKFDGSIPDGQEPYGYITNLFLDEVGDNGIATNVTELGGVTYFFSPVAATANGFTYVGEVVIPQPPQEVVVEEEQQQEEQQSEGGV